jgi:hypothetical protein
LFIELPVQIEQGSEGGNVGPLCGPYRDDVHVLDCLRLLIWIQGLPQWISWAARFAAAVILETTIAPTKTENSRNLFMQIKHRDRQRSFIAGGSDSRPDP